MHAESFQRLPEHVQEIVTTGLDEEIKASFAKIEEARAAGDRETEISFLEGDIIRSSALRKSLTGEDAA